MKTITMLFLSILFSASLAFAHKVAPTKTAEIRVLTYNVQGLPWPIKEDRGELQRIGELLAERRLNGTIPQITVLQEAFKTSKIKKLIKLSGYKYVVEGPKTSDLSPFDPKPKVCPPRSTGCMPREFAPATNGGVYILSDFPILKTNKLAYGYQSCAGLDCFSNKGIVHATIQVPGFSQPLQVFNTHMNSGKASAVSEAKHEVSRQKQVDIMNWFMAKTLGTTTGEAILALGDFNQGPRRHTYWLENKFGMPNAQNFCLTNRTACQIVSKESDDVLYYGTVDHQLYQSGTQLKLTPIELNKTFYDRVGERQVSDHLGLEVVYRLEE